MNKTVSINLGGYYFHIDEDAYQKLMRYLEAVKRSLAPEGRDEIIKDIESRIAELFNDQLKNKTVIGMAELNNAIDVLGQPEDYKIEENTEKSYGTSYSKSGKSRKLFRDKDGSIIGGVAAGFGHYFAIDPLWIRILFIISPFITVGTSIIIYLILWILITPAETTAQKLEMKGEPITLTSIEKKVKEGINEISDKISSIDGNKIASTAKKGTSQIGSTLSEIFSTIFNFFGKILGAFIVLISSLSLVTVVIASIFLLFSSSLSENFLNNHIQTPFSDGLPFWLQGIIIIFALGIPFFFLLILGLKLMIDNLKPLSTQTKYVLLALWVLSLIASIYFIINKVNEVAYHSKSSEKQIINSLATDTLLVKFKYNDFFAKEIYPNHSNYITQDAKGNEIIYSNNISFQALYTDEALPYVLIEKLAEGNTISNAKNRAEKINYSYSIQGNQIILDNFWVTDKINKYRNQEIEIYLYLPENTYFKFDESMQEYDDSNHDFFDLQYDFPNATYKIENKIAKCINCFNEFSNEDILETEGTDSTHTAGIVINDKGVLIKKNGKTVNKDDVESVNFTQKGIEIKYKK